MSGDPTKDIGEKYSTKPTIETVLERINALDEKLSARVDGFEKRIEERITSFEERVGIRLDRIESEVKKTHSEFYDMRADFTELRAAIREHFKEPA
ncbi:MAG: hypothetical protein DMF67_17365 [Acidobacteria bacterium]|nr:MAG: hypothetical protein DMF66_14170 [Acidobacteriota bacterium]PYS81269.1 MAG: hypothetical protein DMF67_17365 [Acidobacteriota bacterium]